MRSLTRAAPPNALTVALAVMPLVFGYAFGGGGSGDSTREWSSVVTYAGALNDENPSVRMFPADRIAIPLEHAFIAGQQSGTG
jgi:hypothetical protein